MKFIMCHACNNVWPYTGTGQRAACPKCNLSIYLHSPKTRWLAVDLDSSVEEVLAMRPEERANLVHAYVDSWNGHLTIGIAIYATDGWHARTRLFEPRDIGLGAADLEVALAEAGATIDTSGRFPLNAALRAHLATLIEQPEKCVLPEKVRIPEDLAGRDYLVVVRVTREAGGVPSGRVPASMYQRVPARLYVSPCCIPCDTVDGVRVPRFDQAVDGIWHETVTHGVSDSGVRLVFAGSERREAVAFAVGMAAEIGAEIDRAIPLYLDGFGARVPKVPTGVPVVAPPVAEGA